MPNVSKLRGDAAPALALPEGETDPAAAAQGRPQFVSSAAMLASAPVPLALFDGELRIVYANDAYCLLVGARGGRQPAGVAEIADYRDLIDNGLRARHDLLLQQLRTGQSASFRIELPMLRPDGETRLVLIDCAPVAGEEEGFIVGLSDVTAIRRQHEREARQRDALDQALEEMVAGLVLFDADDRLVFCNRRYCEFYGVPAELARPGTRFEDMLREELRNGHLGLTAAEEDAFIAARLQRRAADGRIVEQQNRDGRWLQIRERVMTGGWLVGVHIDATDLKTKEESLQESIRELRETRGQLERRTRELSGLALNLEAARDEALGAARAKANFLANMSHELRTPLNAVIGFAELLAAGTSGPLTAQQSEYLEDIRGSGSHLLDVINDILDLSKADAGKIDLEQEDILVGEFLRNTARLMASTAGAKSLAFTVDLPPDMAKIGVNADRRRLRQVLLNLLSNAIKFTEPGGAVSLGAVVTEDGALELVVKDTGIGIAADDMGKVFTPFEQADGSLTRKYEGTGLGMALVKALVDLHQGKVTLESGIGQGTRVGVRLPPVRLRRLP
jgi:two-component system cell cycle sensor histidine kinase PleC